MVTRAARISLSPLLFCAFANVSRADAVTAHPAHATIRGSGNDVAIVYRGNTPNAAQPLSQVPGDSAVLAEAIRLAASGASDDAVIAYLRNHQTGLPTIVAAEDVRQLRKAGAGAPVISYLSRVTALDIGETAEGGASV
ncbi:MAG: hypothetical protein ABI968_10400, partial [Acidobacteriota bacterium]